MMKHRDNWISAACEPLNSFVKEGNLDARTRKHRQEAVGEFFVGKTRDLQGRETFSPGDSQKGRTSGQHRQEAVGQAGDIPQCGQSRTNDNGRGGPFTARGA